MHSFFLIKYSKLHWALKYGKKCNMGKPQFLKIMKCAKKFDQKNEEIWRNSIFRLILLRYTKIWSVLCSVKGYDTDYIFGIFFSSYVTSFGHLKYFISGIAVVKLMNTFFITLYFRLHSALWARLEVIWLFWTM